MSTIEEQLALEQEMKTKGVQAFDDALQRATREGAAGDFFVHRNIISTLITPTAETLQAAIMDATKPGDRSRVAAGIRLARYYEGQYDLLAFLTIRNAINMMAQKECYIVQVANVIGRDLEDQLRFVQAHAEAPAYFAKVWDNINKQKRMRLDRKRKILAAADRAVMDEEWADWSEQERASLGLFCLCAAVDATEAFYFNQGRLRPSSELVKWLEEDCDFQRTLASCNYPMVVKPRPWLSPTSGGFLSKEVSRLFPMIDGAPKEYMRKLHSPAVLEQMKPFYKAINIIQETGWCINRFVYDTAREVRRRNVELYGVPALVENKDYPEFNPLKDKLKLRLRPDNTAEVVRPGDADYEEKGLKFLHEKDQEEFKKWKRDKVAFFHKKAKDESILLSVGSTLLTAERFADYPSLYFVYHADSRGRVYPYTSNLSPQGADLDKALLHFDEEYPLDMRFLKLQITGVYGFDKHSYPDRLNWCSENHDMLMLAGSDPLHPSVREFVGKADSPWQLIAACRDYFLHHSEGKSTTRLWWAQDGACNGLQHFAMMTCDEQAGALVNLVPCDKPADIYQHVADLTHGKLKEDENNPEIQGLGFHALAYHVGVSRKLTKRPTMIKPYSGTRMGATAYVEEFYKEWLEKNPNALASILPPAKKGDDGVIRGGWKRFNIYVGGKVWDSVEESVHLPTKVMECLKKVGRRIGATNKPIYWTVPVTGFLGYQNKRDMSRCNLRAYMFGEVAVKTHLFVQKPTINASGMGSAMSPNFVHSLDSAHMMSTVLAAHEQGIRHFALVHDSYGAPTYHSNDLAYLIRDNFYHLYSDRDVLEEFYYEQQSQHPTVEFPQLPTYGNLNRTEVYNAKYLFS